MRTFWFSFVLFLGLVPNVVLAQANKVQSIISSQLQAFMADDFQAAFQFAAPNIQGMLKSPDNFESMVKNGYPMVYRHRSVLFGEYREQRDKSAQIVTLEALDWSVYDLRYDLIATTNGWRIMGVQLLSKSATGV
ncbi:MAG: DUF4864 domain-containing protein [Pseudomonadota bacterium]